MKERPAIQLELMEDRCEQSCIRSLIPSGKKRPRLVHVTFNGAARDAITMRTGKPPMDVTVCLHPRCTGVRALMPILDQLQELLR